MSCLWVLLILIKILGNLSYCSWSYKALFSSFMSFWRPSFQSHIHIHRPAGSIALQSMRDWVLNQRRVEEIKAMRRTANQLWQSVGGLLHMWRSHVLEMFCLLVFTICWTNRSNRSSSWHEEMCKLVWSTWNCYERGSTVVLEQSCCGARRSNPRVL